MWIMHTMFLSITKYLRKEDQFKHNILKNKKFFSHEFLIYNISFFGGGGGVPKNILLVFFLKCHRVTFTSTLYTHMNTKSIVRRGE